jgi:hypothetical protein
MPEAHEELQELQEGAEHARHGRPMAVVSLTMAILAVLVAVVTLMGHRAHTEEVVLQTQVTDQWAYYQSKNIRGDSYEMFLDHLAVTPTKDPGAAEKIRQKYDAALAHERERQKEIQGEARKMEQEIEMVRRQANRFDLGLGLLEAALVITSITLLTGRRGFWLFGSVLAAAGIMVAVTGFLVHL